VEKREGESCWKSGGGDECVFIPGEGLDCQMRSGSNVMQDVAGGEGDHGATKPQGVVHR
jgi:hypothetical protein